MKKILIFEMTLAFLFAGGCSLSTTCNYELLESYGLNSQDYTLPDKLVYCPSVTRNCCSYDTQLTIYRKWVVMGERDKLFKFYSTYKRNFALIFDFFDHIEMISKKMIEITEDVEGSNCHMIASKINRYRFSILKDEVINSLTRSFKFFYESRQGFYCSLCDADNKDFFWVEEEGFQISEQYCRDFVYKTMNFYVFRFGPFLKAARLYSQFLVSCSAKGNFKKSGVVPTRVKFFKKFEIGGEIETCRKEFDTKSGLKACTEYCQRFNPIRFDEYFEGDLDKILAMTKFLGNRVNTLALKMTNDNVYLYFIQKQNYA